MKLLSLLLLASPLAAQTMFTVPQGYTKITIPAATNGNPSLTAFSANLLTEAAFSGTATIQNNFDADPDSDPQTSSAAQTISVTGADWSAAQWTSQPHLAHIVNAAGDEENFLITDHDTTSLTLETSFDLLSDSRFTASTTLRIRKANTVGSILGSTETPFSPIDRVYLWDGDKWFTILTNGTGWLFFGGDQNLQDATNAIIFPEEGIFVERRADSPVVLTLFGEVPTLNQASTIAGQTSHFISTRYPVGSEPGGIPLPDLNIHSIPGWSPTDRAYYWTGAGWQALLANGSDWFYFGGENNLTSANNLVIPPNSALFITRTSAGSEVSSPLSIPLPYNLLGQ